MPFLLNVLTDGFFAAIACMGFAIVSNPPRTVLLSAGFLAAVGHMTRFALMSMGLGIATSSMGAAMLLTACSIPCSRHWRTPAEMFVFPALLPMIPGMFAYKTILAIIHFLNAGTTVLRETLLVDIVYNGLTTFFIMCALVIGAVLPLMLFHRDLILAHKLRDLRVRKQKK